MINSCNSRALSSATRNHQYTERRKGLWSLAGVLTPHYEIMFHFDKVNYAKPINWGLLRTTNQFFFLLRGKKCDSFDPLVTLIESMKRESEKIRKLKRFDILGKVAALKVLHIRHQICFWSCYAHFFSHRFFRIILIWWAQ